MLISNRRQQRMVKSYNKLLTNANNYAQKPSVLNGVKLAMSGTRVVRQIGKVTKYANELNR